MCLADNTVKSAMQNVSALQARPGMSVKASFTLHVRSAQDTQDSSSFAAALSKRFLCLAGSFSCHAGSAESVTAFAMPADKTWTFGCDTGNQGELQPTFSASLKAVCYHTAIWSLR